MAEKTAGVYIHIPFCKQACHYCNFYFLTGTERKADFMAALQQEIEVRAAELADHRIQSIYLGGGTPSLLDENDLAALFESVYAALSIDTTAEITLEANPDDLSLAYIDVLARSPINRLSIGIQSFFDADLSYMNRAHNASEARASLQMASAAGFENLSIDLIYGTPTLNNDDWVRNLEAAAGYDVSHVSAYALTVEPKTPLAGMIRKGKAAEVDEGQTSEQFRIASRFLVDRGYEHYEISNYARPGLRSRHNSGYWSGRPYLGLGPAAHSYDGHRLRSWNHANLMRYVDGWSQGKRSSQSEELGNTECLNEYLMTALRRSEGISLRWVSDRFGNDARADLEMQIAECNPDWVEHSQERLRLSPEGMLFADRIAASLFTT